MKCIFRAVELFISMISIFDALADDVKSVLTQNDFAGVNPLLHLDYIDLRYGNKVYYKLR